MKERFKSFLNKIFNVPKMLIKFFFFSPLFGVVTGIVAFLIGARMYETGNLESLKGATVRISGSCKQNLQVRVPSLAEDHVKVTSINGEYLTGVIRATRETVVCNLNDIAIDKLPLTYDFKGQPAKIPEITVAIDNSKELELQKYVSKTVRASGICQSGSGDMSLVDKYLDVTQLKKKQNGDFAFIAVQKDDGKIVECITSNLKYEIVTIVVNDKRLEEGSSQLQQTSSTDYVGKTILITGTCFPDTKLPKDKNRQLYYPMLNARVQVTANKFINGKLVWLAGAMVERAAMIECNMDTYTFTYKEYDASSMNVKTQTFKEK